MSIYIIRWAKSACPKIIYIYIYMSTIMHIIRWAKSASPQILQFTAKSFTTSFTTKLNTCSATLTKRSRDSAV